MCVFECVFCPNSESNHGDDSPSQRECPEHHVNSLSVCLCACVCMCVFVSSAKGQPLSQTIASLSLGQCVCACVHLLGTLRLQSQSFFFSFSSSVISSSLCSSFLVSLFSSYGPLLRTPFLPTFPFGMSFSHLIPFSSPFPSSLLLFLIQFHPVSCIGIHFLTSSITFHLSFCPRSLPFLAVSFFLTLFKERHLS